MPLSGEVVRVVVDASPLRDARRTAGVGRYTASLLRALRGIDGVEVHAAVPRRGPLREAAALRWLGAQPAVAASAWRGRPHLVHQPAADPVLGWPLRRQVVTVHDTVAWRPDRPLGGRLSVPYFAAQQRRLRGCAAIIAVSEAVAAEAREHLRIDPRRVHVVPEGVDAVFAATGGPGDPGTLRRLGVSEGFVLWVGSLRAHDPRKAIDVLLDAVAALPAPRPQLVLAGAGGDEAERVARAATARGLDVALTGYVSDLELAVLYRHAAVVALPSRTEGFGLPLLEALACGAPVVASRAGALVELAGDAALLIPPGDTTRLAEALGSVLADAELASRLRRAGPDRARPYRWEHTATRTAAVYRTALGWSH